MQRKIGLILGCVLEIAFAVAIVLISIPLWISFSINGYSLEASENSQSSHVSKNDRIFAILK